MKSIIQFIGEVKLELSKVVWPKADEWYGATIVVLMLVCVFAVYLYLVDFGLSRLIEQIFKIYSK